MRRGPDALGWVFIMGAAGFGLVVLLVAVVVLVGVIGVLL